MNCREMDQWKDTLKMKPTKVDHVLTSFTAKKAEVSKAALISSSLLKNGPYRKTW